MPESLVVPMAVLALWTILILNLIPIARIRAARAGRVHVKDFRYGESPSVPGDVSLPNRDYMNLLELPVLFYTACCVALVSARIDPVMMVLAWAFVAARIAHSLVHLTYNNVIHRLIVFAVGVTILLIMWIWQLWWVLG